MQDSCIGGVNARSASGRQPTCSVCSDSPVTQSSARHTRRAKPGTSPVRRRTRPPGAGHKKTQNTAPGTAARSARICSVRGAVHGVGSSPAPRTALGQALLGFTPGSTTDPTTTPHLLASFHGHPGEELDRALAFVWEVGLAATVDLRAYDGRGVTGPVDNGSAPWARSVIRVDFSARTARLAVPFDQASRVLNEPVLKRCQRRCRG